MSYTKMFSPAGVTIAIKHDNVKQSVDATVVQLTDTGDLVAVGAVCIVQPHSGEPTIIAAAKVINSDGTDKQDVNGQPIATSFNHTSNSQELSDAGSGDPSAGMPVVQKACLMAVLGEDTSPLWQDPIHASMLATASIRTNILSAAHAGPLAGGSLL